MSEGGGGGAALLMVLMVGSEVVVRSIQDDELPSYDNTLSSAYSF